MQGPAIYESGSRKRRSGWERNRYKQGVRLGESSCVEPDHALLCTARVSAAPWRYEVWRAAHSFACLAGSVVEAFPLAEFLALGQSVTLCSVLPQKRQSWSLKRQSHSSGVSLPFLPSLSVFGFFGLDDDEDFNWAGVCKEDAMGWELLLSEDCFSLSIWARAVFEEACLSRLILAWRSQYHWLRTCTWYWRGINVLGFPIWVSSSFSQSGSPL